MRCVHAGVTRKRVHLSVSGMIGPGMIGGTGGDEFYQIRWPDLVRHIRPSVFSADDPSLTLLPSRLFLPLFLPSLPLARPPLSQPVVHDTLTNNRNGAVSGKAGGGSYRLHSNSTHKYAQVLVMASFSGLIHLSPSDPI